MNFYQNVCENFGVAYPLIKSWIRGLLGYATHTALRLDGALKFILLVAIGSFFFLSDLIVGLETYRFQGQSWRWAHCIVLISVLVQK